MVHLPKVTDPPTIMGRFKEQFCKFHRAIGHDTENCFVLKNIVQDRVDKNILGENKTADQPAILAKSLQSYSQQKANTQKKPKHEGWRCDRQFTPLDQTLESMLEYMLPKIWSDFQRLSILLSLWGNGRINSANITEHWGMT